MRFFLQLRNILGQPVFQVTKDMWYFIATQYFRTWGILGHVRHAVFYSYTIFQDTGYFRSRKTHGILQLHNILGQGYFWSQKTRSILQLDTWYFKDTQYFRTLGILGHVRHSVFFSYIIFQDTGSCGHVRHMVFYSYAIFQDMGYLRSQKTCGILQLRNILGHGVFQVT